MIKLSYNAPTVLSFSILAIAVQAFSSFDHGFNLRYFMVRGDMSFVNPLDYFRLFSHVIGHGNWAHLFGNLTYILLLGPILEEKYGSGRLLVMIVIAAGITGLINILLFSTGLLGASGIVFMFILLVSIVDFRQGTVPLTFVIIAVIFLGAEVMKIAEHDQISQSAHIAGGTIGSAFGFIFARKAAR